MCFQLLIHDKDKFATLGELIFFYPCQNLPETAVIIDADKKIFAIHLADFEQANLALPENIELLPFRQLLPNLSREQANLLTKAMQVLRWRDEHGFCSRCGSPTVQHDFENAMVCTRCDFHQYPRIQPCVIVAIVKKENGISKILLAHHHRASSSGMYGLIAGFVEVGESLEDCVHREVAEEVGLKVDNLRFVSSQPWAFPSNLMVGFVADVVSGEIQIDDSELIHADFFAFDNLPKIPMKGTIASELIELVRNLL